MARASPYVHGTWNWDGTLVRLLSIVLVTSLGCCSGDVALTPLYNGTEYLRYRHVEPSLGGDGLLKIENLKSHVELKYRKNSKDTMSESFHSYFRPLDEVHYLHMNPIALFLIRALRHGLVRGSTHDEIRRVRRQFPTRQG